MLFWLPLSVQAVVAAMDDQSITIDANHPLAGKELTFDVSPVLARVLDSLSAPRVAHDGSPPG